VAQESLLLLFGDSEYNRSTRGLAPCSPTRLNHATHDHLPPTGISQTYLRELRALRALAPHPNVVTLVGAVLTPLALVLERTDRGNLAECLDQEQWQANAGLVERCALLEDMAAGLAHMHAMGYIHRDVKPHNVLLTWAQDQRRPGSAPRLVAKIADLGTALCLLPGQPAHHTQPGQLWINPQDAAKVT